MLTRGGYFARRGFDVPERSTGQYWRKGWAHSTTPRSALR